MRGSSEIEEKLENALKCLCWPFTISVRWLSKRRIIRQLVSLVAFLSKPFRTVWNRYWSFIGGDDIPDELACVHGLMQKKIYQRSALVVWPVIGACVVVISLGILSEEPTMVTITNARPPITVADMYAPHKDSTSTDSIPGAKQNVPKYVQHGSGFLGFIDLRPRDVALPDPLTTVPSEIYAVGPPILFNEEEPISFSPVEGDEDIVVIPFDADYFFSEQPEPEKELLNRPCSVTYKPDPQYPLFAEEEGKQGKVVILVFIDSTGNKVPFPLGLEGDIQTLEYVVQGREHTFDYVVAEEEPTGSFFASSFIRVLPQWRFLPKVENGIAVNTWLLITYQFCTGINCSRLELKQMREKGHL